MDNNQKRWVEDAWREHHSSVVRYAESILRNRDPEEAKDAAQHVFIQLCKQDRAALGDKVAAWLFCAVRNKCLHRIRKLNQFTFVDSIYGDDDPSGERADNTFVDGREQPDAAMDNHEESFALSAELDAALQSLKPTARNIVHLKYSKGYSCNKISALTGKNVGNVWFILHDARQRLRKALTRKRKSGIV